MRIKHSFNSVRKQNMVKIRLIVLLIGLTALDCDLQGKVEASLYYVTISLWQIIITTFISTKVITTILFNVIKLSR